MAVMFGLTMDDTDLRRWAEFSPCKKYRYLLGREWNETRPRVCFIGKNPSKAGSEFDDMTATKYVGFAKAIGAGSYEAANLWPFIATYEHELLDACVAGVEIGPNGDAKRANEHLRAMLTRAQHVIVCWGALRPWMEDAASIMLDCLGLDALQPMCFGTTRDGFPLHLSRLPYSYAAKFAPYAPTGARR